jgi:hypothetical protein
MYNMNVSHTTIYYVKASKQSRSKTKEAESEKGGNGQKKISNKRYRKNV